jgi:uncharacterized protein YndB with AHSA1/START domain
MNTTDTQLHGLTENAIVIERIFNAPIDLVWQLWTVPEHFKKWYGPKGATIPVAEMDVRVGGRRLLCMEMQTPSGGMKMWNAGEYIEVVPNERLVYTDSMADENGNVVSPSAMGMPDGHPETTQVTIQLEDFDGRTKMVMTHAGVAADSPGAGGWEQAFTKMTDHIETARHDKR